MTTPSTHPLSPIARREARRRQFADNKMLDMVRGRLQRSPELADQVAWDAWVTDQTIRAQKVALFRDYADGDHRSYLSDEMRNMLRVGRGAELSADFTINHMDNIIETVGNRLHLTQVQGDNAAATAWADTLMRDNRIDAVQTVVHDSALRDADTFMLAEWDEEGQRVRWSHEDAFDGVEGMIAIYGADQRQPVVAIKIWQMKVDGEKSVLTTKARVNFYYADRIERYIEVGSGNGGLAYYENGTTPPVEPWVNPATGEPLGFPVVHFANQSKRYSAWGKSVIEDVVPLQDVLNRTLVSMVMAAELTAFQIRIIKGIKPPAALQPGMWLSAYFTHPANHAQAGQPRPPNELEIKWLDAIKAETLTQGELTQFLQQADFIINSMYEVVSLPRAGATSPDASGEAQKQREVNLLGRVRRCQITFGNTWEDLIALSWRIQSAFGTDAPAESPSGWSSKWESGQVRDEAQVVETVLKMLAAGLIDQRTALGEVSAVFGWDGKKVEDIVNALGTAQTERLRALGMSIPQFG